MKVVCSEGIRTLMSKDFKDVNEFYDFVENMHNIIPQFIKLGNLKYYVSLVPPGDTFYEQSYKPE